MKDLFEMHKRILDERFDNKLEVESCCLEEKYHG